MVRMLLGILKLVVILKMVVMLNVVDRVYEMMLRWLPQSKSLQMVDTFKTH